MSLKEHSAEIVMEPKAEKEFVSTYRNTFTLQQRSNEAKRIMQNAEKAGREEYLRLTHKLLELSWLAFSSQLKSI